VANSAAKYFIERLWPIFIYVMNECITERKEPLIQDSVWSFRTPHRRYSLGGTLLKAMETAFQVYANDNPDEFRLFAAPLRESCFETTHFLLLKGYTANGKAFASEAVDYMCGNTAVLKVGYSGAQQQVASDLIRSISPYCGVKDFSKLESEVLNYFTLSEKTGVGYRWHGSAQWVLLTAMEDRLSAKGLKRLAEWRRKFVGRKIPTTRETKVREVTSPVNKLATTKMSDNQWLRAISVYNKRDYGSRREEFLKGGAHELSQLLEETTKQNPERFARLCLNLPGESHPYYFHAILRGLENAALPAELVEAVCEHCHALPERPCGMYLCDYIGKQSGDVLSKGLLEAVAWYAVNDPDPESELWKIPANGGDPYYGGDMESHGLNSVRGRVARALASLIYDNASVIGELYSALEALVKDPSLAVRSQVAEALIAVFTHEPDLAVTWFLKLCDVEDDDLLGTHAVEHFIWYAVERYYRELSPLLERMVSSSNPEVVEAGARQGCIAALGLPEAKSWVERCLNGDVPFRKAAAEVMEANLANASFRQLCEETLDCLMADENKGVRSKAARWLWSIKDKGIGEYEDLARKFLQSPAFLDDTDALMHRLEESEEPLVELSYEMAERIIDARSGKDPEKPQIHGLADSELSKIVVRAYSQATDTKVRNRCLDIIDDLSRLNSYAIEEAVEQAAR